MHLSFREKEKYSSELKFRFAQLRRWPLMRTLEHLTRWDPLDRPKEGYSIIIGCNTRLARMLNCNLKFLAQQDLHHLDKILVVLDRPREEMLDDIEAVIRSRFPMMPLEFVYYSSLQRWVCTVIRWPWVPSWLSWSIGIGRLSTRYGFLHDFDAMLLRSDIIEERFLTIQERSHEYVGVRFYDGNGVMPEDELATTFELMFDAQFIRSAFAPLDLFNHVARFRGRRVDFDTFLYPQSQGGRASTMPIAEQDMVHPSQLICQFEGIVSGRGSVPLNNNLLLVPYFLFLAGEPTAMAEMTRYLESCDGPKVPYFGKSLDLVGMDSNLFRWIVKQAYRLERRVAGHTREDVRRYFSAADAFMAQACKRHSILGSEEAKIECELDGALGSYI
jgi:hypothetical protein